MHDALWYLVGILIVGVAAWLSVRAILRAVRRRWRRWVATAMAGVGAGGLRWVASQPATSPAWWRVQRQRHQMWRAVSAATGAVEHAQAAGAPMGDLPHLAGDLRRTADRLDRVLLADAARVGARRSAALPEALPGRRDFDQLLAAAKEIHDTALLSLGEHTSPDVSALTSAVRVESEAFRAGLASARRGRVPGGV